MVPTSTCIRSVSRIAGFSPFSLFSTIEQHFSHSIYLSISLLQNQVAPNIKFFFGRNARARLKEYTGNESVTIEKLSHFGIPASALPKEVGGDWIYDGSWYKKALLQGLTVDQITNL